jgi:DNA-binding NarL/FixJ family response regulator
VSTRIRVIIVDDHPMIRLGLQSMLDDEPEIDVVGVAADGSKALQLIEHLTPDVVITDLRMPNLDGVGLTTAVTAAHPTTKVLIFTTYETDIDIVRAVEAGAIGYLLKDTPPEQVAQAISSASRGETVLAPAVAAKLMARLRSPALEALTKRELEVLQAVGRGLTNADIGKTLFISESTVKTHLLRIFTKLNVDDRTAAVTVAIRQGILATDE